MRCISSGFLVLKRPNSLEIQHQHRSTIFDVGRWPEIWMAAAWFDVKNSGVSGVTQDENDMSFKFTLQRAYPHCRKGRHDESLPHFYFYLKNFFSSSEFILNFNWYYVCTWHVPSVWNKWWLIDRTFTKDMAVSGIDWKRSVFQKYSKRSAYSSNILINIQYTKSLMYPGCWMIKGLSFQFQHILVFMTILGHSCSWTFNDIRHCAYNN